MHTDAATANHKQCTPNILCMTERVTGKNRNKMQIKVKGKNGKRWREKKKLKGAAGKREKL